MKKVLAQAKKLLIGKSVARNLENRKEHSKISYQHKKIKMDEKTFLHEINHPITLLG